MRRISLWLLAAGVAALAGFFGMRLTAPPALAGKPEPDGAAPLLKPAMPPLPVARVVLFSSGVGYFQREGEVEGEALEGVLQGAAVVVGDGGDLAAAEVLQHQALEQVVDVFHRERQIHSRVSVHAPGALEVADAAGVQHHLVDR